MQTISTKLSIPPLRSRLVARMRLFESLDRGMACGFVLVSAPAGYGKSTLLSAWLKYAQVRSIWLSLDDGDNDPARFLAYLAEAFRKLDPSFGEALEQMLRSTPQPDVVTVLTPLINRIAEGKHAVCLVFDDYHTIQSPEAHQIVRFLLEHRPTQLCLLIATRADPPLSLPKLRARSMMVELRQADLCFTAQEAADFLKHTMGLQISTEDVLRITDRTEGWIAGLQMAALTMQNTEDISGFITNLSGSHHYIFDYLLEEILGREPPKIRRFLLDTSILDQFSAPLCDVLLDEKEGSGSSTILLEQLERANLFIIPLDQERRWYRYHALFAELLQTFLQRNDSAQIPVLHARASIWFEQQSLIPDAIHHALAAGAWERVSRLISANVFALLEQNALNTVARQLDRFSSDKKQVLSWLCVGRAWLAAYTGQLSAVEPLLEQAEADKDSCESIHDQKKLLGHCATIRAFAAWIGGWRVAAAQAAQTALDRLPETETVIRCQAATVLGLSQDNMEARARALEQAMAYAQKCDVSHITLFAHGCWAYMLLSQGRLHATFDACQEAIQYDKTSGAPQRSPSLSHSYATLSLVLWEWNDLEGAIKYAREAVSLAHRWEQVDALHFAYTQLGSALFASGDIEGAFAILRLAWQVARRTSTWFEEITIGQEVEWHLAQGNLAAAVERLQLVQVDLHQQPGQERSLLTPQATAQILLAQKQYHQALIAIASILEDLRARKVIYLTVRVLVWQALAYEGLNRKGEAMASLKEALQLAAAEGYIRSFFVPCGAIIPLLKRAQSARIMGEVVEPLLATVEHTDRARPHTADASFQTAQPQFPPTDNSLVEPLSKREREVLLLLANGCSDKKIAENLVIASETVHKHLKNIYGKLDVHSRAEAVVRARALRLL